MIKYYIFMKLSEEQLQSEQSQGGAVLVRREPSSARSYKTSIAYSSSSMIHAAEEALGSAWVTKK